MVRGCAKSLAAAKVLNRGAAPPGPSCARHRCSSAPPADRPMLRLRHRLRERDALARCFRQIPGPQSVCRHPMRIETGEGGALLDDEVDGLRCQRLAADVAPLVDRPEQRAGGDGGGGQPGAERSDRLADDPGIRAVRGIGRLGPAEAERRGWQRADSSPEGRSASKRTSSTRSAATSERRRPPEPKASSRMARSRMSAVRFIQQVRSSASMRSPVSARSLLRIGGRAAARTERRTAVRT